MKDIKVIVGPDTGPMGDDHGFVTPATLVVRNQDTNGRRLGIFTRDGKAVAGQQLNHADALHTPKEVLNVPQGYGSGVEVSLSPKRDYFKVFGISQSWVPEQHLAGFRREMYRENGMDESLYLHVSDTIPDLSKLRTTLTTGDMAIGAEKSLSALNSFVSFTMVFGGRDYHIGLDLAKHPAHVTADLNYRLNRIHPQLRGFVNAKPTADWEYREIEFHITPPDGLEVIFPITTFGVVEDLSVETPQGRTFKSVHLNAQLSNAIMVTKAKGIQAVSNTVTSVNVNAPRSSLSAMLDNPYLVSLDTFGKVVEGTLELHTGMVTVPASAFKTWDRDERLCFSILKLERKYVDGKAYRIKSIKYVDESGRALPFDEEHADLFLLRGVDEAGLPTVPAVFINDILEREVDELEGYSAPTASQIQFAETGGLNEDNAAAYIALFPRPSEDNSNSIFFRNSNLATYIQIQYVLDYVDELPQVKMNDFGRLDYHRIKTEDHGFLPVSFTAKPITGWGLEFVVEGQEERYLSHKLEHDEETNSTLMITHGTVGEAVVLSDLDYDQVLAPTVDIPFYHLYDEIGAQTWLNFNLLPTGVVTSTATLSEKARFEVVFPRTEMMPTIEHITQTLIAGHVEGEVLLKGEMTNANYTIQPHVHALTTEWSFTINGTSVTPARAVDFNKSTGEWSVPIAIADLVAAGPGNYTLRVSLTSEYPWLKTPEVYSVPLLFVVMSSVQGVEDDVTFIGTSIFDETVDGSETSGYRLVDLDSGEILATGENVFALQDDATTRGLVDINLIYGDDLNIPEEYLGSSDGSSSGTTLAEITVQLYDEHKFAVGRSMSDAEVRYVKLKLNPSANTPANASATYRYWGNGQVYTLDSANRETDYLEVNLIPEMNLGLSMENPYARNVFLFELVSSTAVVETRDMSIGVWYQPYVNAMTTGWSLSYDKVGTGRVTVPLTPIVNLYDRLSQIVDNGLADIIDIEKTAPETFTINLPDGMVGAHVNYHNELMTLNSGALPSTIGADKAITFKPKTTLTTHNPNGIVFSSIVISDATVSGDETFITYINLAMKFRVQ